MQTSIKCIDKYQFDENLFKSIHNIETVIAYHTVLKTNFWLKKLNISQGVNSLKYNYLIREVQILKKCSNENILKCHKLLKTANNIYLIYDYFEGVSLAERLKTEISFHQKCQIAHQLVCALQSLAKQNILYLSLSSNTIFINPEFKIKLTCFGNAVDLPSGEISRSIQFQRFNVNDEDSISPEVLNQVASKYSDIFSLGLVFQQLFAKELALDATKKNFLSPSIKKIEKLKEEDSVTSEIGNMIQKMISVNFENRLKIEVIGDYLAKVLSQETSGEQSPTANSIKSGISIRSIKSLKSSSSEKSSAQEPTTPTINREKQFTNLQLNPILRKIIKKRNFYKFLLMIAESCLENRENKLEDSLVIAFLFVKKSTITICQLARLMNVGQNEDMKIEEKLKQKVMKHSKFKQLASIINKEMSYSQKRLLRIADSLEPLLACRNSNLLTEIKKERINSAFFTQCLAQFLKAYETEVNTQKELWSQYNAKNLIGYCFLFLINDYGSYEQAFDQLFSECGCPIEKDYYMEELLKMEANELVLMLLQNERESTRISLKKCKSLFSQN